MSSPRPPKPALRRRAAGSALAVAGVLLLAANAAAAEPKGKEEGNYVSISPVAAPIVVQGRLVNYVFVTVRLKLAPGADMPKLRDREPYFRDALVREAHRHPFVKAGDYTHVDEGAVVRAMTLAARRIAGPSAVAGVEIVSTQSKRSRVAAPAGPGVGPTLLNP